MEASSVRQLTKDGYDKAMLDGSQFAQWCRQMGLPSTGRLYIEQLRSSPPSRRGRSAKGNVSDRDPSRKMGVTIQFESHRHELAGIYEMEYDPDVLEYYDQPPAIKLCYQAINGQRVGVLHTPDFFVLRRIALAGKAGLATAGTSMRPIFRESIPHKRTETLRVARFGGLDFIFQ